MKRIIKVSRQNIVKYKSSIIFEKIKVEKKFDFLDEKNT